MEKNVESQTSQRRRGQRNKKHNPRNYKEGRKKQNSCVKCKRQRPSKNKKGAPWKKRSRERIARLVEELSEGINEMYNSGYAIGILRVPPRVDIVEEDRKNFNQQIYRKQNRRKGITLIAIQVGMTTQDYIKEVLKDGINTKEEKGRCGLL